MDTYDNEMVKCKAFGHAWDVSAPDLRFTPKQQSSRQSPARCERCHTKRFQWLGWDGKVIAGWYEYAEAYKKINMTKQEAKLYLLDFDKPRVTRRRRTA
jgi:hypothetical protein